MHNNYNSIDVRDKQSKITNSSHENQPQSQTESPDNASVNLPPNTQQQILVSPPHSVKPLFDLTEDGNVIGRVLWHHIEYIVDVTHLCLMQLLQSVYLILWMSLVIMNLDLIKKKSSWISSQVYRYIMSLYTTFVSVNPFIANHMSTCWYSMTTLTFSFIIVSLLLALL